MSRMFWFMNGSACVSDGRESREHVFDALRMQTFVWSSFALRPSVCKSSSVLTSPRLWFAIISRCLGSWKVSAVNKIQSTSEQIQRYLGTYVTWTWRVSIRFGPWIRYILLLPAEHRNQVAAWKLCRNKWYQQPWFCVPVIFFSKLNQFIYEYFDPKNIYVW